MLHRVHTAGRVLPGNLPKIHSQDLSSFLYANKRCSSNFDHRLCVLVLEHSCSSSLKHPSSSLLDSGSPSPKPLSLSLLEDSLLLVARAVASTALPSWGLVRVASTCLRPTSAAVDSHFTERGPGWCVPAEAGHEERMLLYRPDSEVVNLPHMADTCNESGNATEKDSSPITTVPDHC
jgi:hypothetical protein